MTTEKADLDEVILDWYIQELKLEGWQVVSRTPTSAHIARVRVWNRYGILAVAVFVLLGLIFSSPWLFAAAIFIALVVFVDYLRQTPKENTITPAVAREAARLLEGGV